MRHIIFHTSPAIIVLISVCTIVLCSENGKQHYKEETLHLHPLFA
jgi:hypothetical protein